MSIAVPSLKEIEKESRNRPNFAETTRNRPPRLTNTVRFLNIYGATLFFHASAIPFAIWRFPPTVSMRIYRPKYDFMKINAAFVGRIDK